MKKDKATYFIGVDPYRIESTPDAVVYKFDRKDCQTVTTKSVNQQDAEYFKQMLSIADYYNVIPKTPKRESEYHSFDTLKKVWRVYDKCLKRGHFATAMNIAIKYNLQTNANYDLVTATAFLAMAVKP